MTPTEVSNYVDAASAALGIRLRQDHRPGVLRYFTLASEFATLIDAVPLQAHDEAATTFTPVEPREAEG